MYHGEAIEAHARKAHTRFCWEAWCDPGPFVNVYDKERRELIHCSLLPPTNLGTRFALEAGDIVLLQRHSNGSFGVVIWCRA